jgi:hypothetical protein
VFGDTNKHDGNDDDRGKDDEHDRSKCERDLLYVSDGGQNSVWQVDINTGGFSVLTNFPPIPNPLFPGGPGGPLLDAVPTGITFFQDKLLVTLFRGFPFPAGTSTVQQVDPLTGSRSPLITGLKTAIDILGLKQGNDTDYLVLQHGSGPGPFPTPPGVMLRFETPAGPPTLLADCLTEPTSMVFSRRTNTVYITELGGRVVSIPVTP